MAAVRSAVRLLHLMMRSLRSLHPQGIGHLVESYAWQGRRRRRGPLAWRGRRIGLAVLTTPCVQPNTLELLPCTATTHAIPHFECNHHPTFNRMIPTYSLPSTGHIE